MNWTRLLLGSFFMLGILSTYAQNDSVFSFSLKEAQTYAINNYYMSKNAQLDIKKAEKKVWETTAIGLPQVNIGIDYTYMPEIPELNFPQTLMAANYKSNPNQQIVASDFWNKEFFEMIPGEPIKMGVEHNVSYNLMLTQLIFSGEYIVGLQASKAYKAMSEESFEKTTLDIKDNIAGTYFGLLILNQNLSIIEKTIENLKESEKQAKMFFAQGMTEDTDVDQISLTLKRTENSREVISRQYETLKKMLNYQLGLSSDQNVTLTEKIDELIDANIIQSADYQFNLEENIDYSMLNTQEKLMDLSLKREKSLFLPQVSGFYKYSDQVKSADFNTNIKHIFGLSASVPVFSSGMKLSKVSQARIELEKAQNMKEQESQRLIVGSIQAKENYKSALEKYMNEKANFSLSEKVYNKAVSRQKEGMISSLDLTMINNQFLQAQLSYATAVQELLTAKVKMDKAFNKL